MTKLHPLPTGWSWATLGEVGTWGSGGTPKSGVARYYGGQHKWANIGDLSDGPVSSTERSITDGGLSESSAKLVPPGTLLVGMYGSIGKLGITMHEMATNQAIAACQPGDAVTVRWLFYWLLSQRDALSAAGKGGTQRNISQTILKAWPVPVAPLEEQQAVVAKLDYLLSHIEKPLSALENIPTRRSLLEKAKIAQVLDEVGQPTVSWGDVGSTLNGKSFPSQAYATSGVKLLRPGNLDANGQVTWRSASTQHLPRTYADENPQHLLAGRILVMNLTAQSLADDFLGRVCVSGPTDEFLLNQRIAALSSEHASVDYLYWVFRSPSFRSFIASRNTGSTIQHVSTRQLDEFTFPLPNPEVQSHVVEHLRSFASAASRLEVAASVTVERAQVLRRSVLKAALEGRLTSQDTQGGASPMGIEEAVAS